METVKISPDFAIVIPQSVREALRLQPGEELKIFIEDKSIVLERPRSIRDLRGMAKGMKWSSGDRDRNDRY